VRECFRGVSRKLVRFWKVLDVFCAKSIVSLAAVYTLCVFVNGSIDLLDRNIFNPEMFFCLN
jgi:hypothetical protein